MLHVSDFAASSVHRLSLTQVIFRNKKILLVAYRARAFPLALRNVSVVGGDHGGRWSGGASQIDGTLQFLHRGLQQRQLKLHHTIGA